MDVFTPAQLSAVQPSNVLKIRNFECAHKIFVGKKSNILTQLHVRY